MRIIKTISGNIYHEYKNEMNSQSEFLLSIYKILLEIGMSYQDKEEFIRDLQNGKSFISYFQSRLVVPTFAVINIASTECKYFSEELELKKKIKSIIEEMKRWEEMYAKYLSYFYIRLKEFYLGLGYNGSLIPYQRTSTYSSYIPIDINFDINYSEELINELAKTLKVSVKPLKK